MGGIRPRERHARTTLETRASRHRERLQIFERADRGWISTKKRHGIKHPRDLPCTGFNSAEELYGNELVQARLYGVVHHLWDVGEIGEQFAAFAVDARYPAKGGLAIGQRLLIVVTELEGDSSGKL